MINTSSTSTPLAAQHHRTPRTTASPAAAPRTIDGVYLSVDALDAPHRRAATPARDDDDILIDDDVDVVDPDADLLVDAPLDAAHPMLPPDFTPIKPPPKSSRFAAASASSSSAKGTTHRFHFHVTDPDEVGLASASGARLGGRSVQRERQLRERRVRCAAPRQGLFRLQRVCARRLCARLRVARSRRSIFALYTRFLLGEKHKEERMHDMAEPSLTVLNDQLHSIIGTLRPMAVAAQLDGPCLYVLAIALREAGLHAAARVAFWRRRDRDAAALVRVERAGDAARRPRHAAGRRPVRARPTRSRPASCSATSRCRCTGCAPSSVCAPRWRCSATSPVCASAA
jgi:hypothetical protein